MVHPASAIPYRQPAPTEGGGTITSCSNSTRTVYCTRRKLLKSSSPSPAPPASLWNSYVGSYRTLATHRRAEALGPEMRGGLLAAAICVVFASGGNGGAVPRLGAAETAVPPELVEARVWRGSERDGTPTGARAGRVASETKQWHRFFGRRAAQLYFDSGLPARTTRCKPAAADSVYHRRQRWRLGQRGRKLLQPCCGPPCTAERFGAAWVVLSTAASG